MTGFTKLNKMKSHLSLQESIDISFSVVLKGLSRAKKGKTGSNQFPS